MGNKGEDEMLISGYYNAIEANNQEALTRFGYAQKIKAIQLSTM